MRTISAAPSPRGTIAPAATNAPPLVATRTRPFAYDAAMSSRSRFNPGSSSPPPLGQSGEDQLTHVGLVMRGERHDLDLRPGPHTQKPSCTVAAASSATGPSIVIIGDERRPSSTAVISKP